MTDMEAGNFADFMDGVPRDTQILIYLNKDNNSELLQVCRVEYVKTIDGNDEIKIYTAEEKTEQPAS